MKVIIEKQSASEGGGFVAYNDGQGLVSVIGTGATIGEAKDDFYNSLHEMEDCYREAGEDVPGELTEAVEFRFSLASVFEAFPWLNVTKLAQAIGINASLLHQYKSGRAYISEAQLARVEAGIHTMAAELAAVKLT